MYGTREGSDLGYGTGSDLGAGKGSNLGVVEGTDLGAGEGFYFEHIGKSYGIFGDHKLNILRIDYLGVPFTFSTKFLGVVRFFLWDCKTNS